MLDKIAIRLPHVYSYVYLSTLIKASAPLHGKGSEVVFRRGFFQLLRLSRYHHLSFVKSSLYFVISAIVLTILVSLFRMLFFVLLGISNG